MIKRRILQYPAHHFEPKDLLSFLETKAFTKTWEHLQLGDDDLACLQIIIMANPGGAPVVPGCEGLRKLRFSPPAWDKGKSGSLRILYVHFERDKLVFLIAVYPKSVTDDISEVGKRKIAQLIREMDNQLSNGRRNL